MLVVKGVTSFFLSGFGVSLCPRVCLYVDMKVAREINSKFREQKSFRSTQCGMHIG